MTGGAVCFSFGTFWNEWIWEIRDKNVDTQEEWHLIPDGPKTANVLPVLPKIPASDQRTAIAATTTVGRITVTSAQDFEEVMMQSQPVIITGLDLGRCTEIWNKDYLIRMVGKDRQVVVHDAQTEHMNFLEKNFAYVTKDFGTFLEEIHGGARQYLRSLSAEQPSKKAADFAADFPELREDFRLPDQLKFVNENTHSSPLRISGPVSMWLHYDVRARPLL